MKKIGWTLASAGLVAATGVVAVGSGPAGGDDADPAVLASREAASVAVPKDPGYQRPPDVQPGELDPLTTGATRMGDLYRLSAVQRTGGYIELEGAPDLVVEVVSNHSVGKDLRRLPPLYAAAGVPELWLVDARREIRFEIRTLGADGYRILEPDAEGWILSPLLGVRFRLRQFEPRPGRWSYRLEHQK